LKNLSRIEIDEIYFQNWITQAKTLSEFNNIMEKLK